MNINPANNEQDKNAFKLAKIVIDIGTPLLQTYLQNYITTNIQTDVAGFFRVKETQNIQNFHAKCIHSAVKKYKIGHRNNYPNKLDTKEHGKFIFDLSTCISIARNYIFQIPNYKWPDIFDDNYTLVGQSDSVACINLLRNIRNQCFSHLTLFRLFDDVYDQLKQSIVKIIQVLSTNQQCRDSYLAELKKIDELKFVELKDFDSYREKLLNGLSNQIGDVLDYLNYLDKQTNVISNQLKKLNSIVDRDAETLKGQLISIIKDIKKNNATLNALNEKNDSIYTIFKEVQEIRHVTNQINDQVNQANDQLAEISSHVQNIDHKLMINNMFDKSSKLKIGNSYDLEGFLSTEFEDYFKILVLCDDHSCALDELTRDKFCRSISSRKWQLIIDMNPRSREDDGFHYKIVDYTSQRQNVISKVYTELDQLNDDDKNRINNGSSMPYILANGSTKNNVEKPKMFERVKDKLKLVVNQMMIGKERFDFLIVNLLLNNDYDENYSKHFCNLLKINELFYFENESNDTQILFILDVKFNCSLIVNSASSYIQNIETTIEKEHLSIINCQIEKLIQVFLKEENFKSDIELSRKPDDSNSNDTYVISVRDFTYYKTLMEIFYLNYGFVKGEQVNDKDYCTTIRENFISGNQISREGLYIHEHTSFKIYIERELTSKITSDIESVLKRETFWEKNLHHLKIEYEPSAGATTLLFTILYRLREKAVCLLIKENDYENKEFIDSLSKLSSECNLPLILGLDRGENDNYNDNNEKIKSFLEKLKDLKIRSILIHLVMVKDLDRKEKAENTTSSSSVGKKSRKNVPKKCFKLKSELTKNEKSELRKLYSKYLDNISDDYEYLKELNTDILPMIGVLCFGGEYKRLEHITCMFLNECSSKTLDSIFFISVFNKFTCKIFPLNFFSKLIAKSQKEIRNLFEKKLSIQTDTNLMNFSIDDKKALVYLFKYCDDSSTNAIIKGNSTYENRNGVGILHNSLGKQIIDFYQKKNNLDSNDSNEKFLNILIETIKDALKEKYIPVTCYLNLIYELFTERNKSSKYSDLVNENLKSPYLDDIFKRLMSIFDEREGYENVYTLLGTAFSRVKFYENRDENGRRVEQLMNEGMEIIKKCIEKKKNDTHLIATYADMLKKYVKYHVEKESIDNEQLLNMAKLSLENFSKASKYKRPDHKFNGLAFLGQCNIRIDMIIYLSELDQTRRDNIVKKYPIFNPEKLEEEIKDLMDRIEMLDIHKNIYIKDENMKLEVENQFYNLKKVDFNSFKNLKEELHNNKLKLPTELIIKCLKWNDQNNDSELAEDQELDFPIDNRINSDTYSKLIEYCQSNIDSFDKPFYMDFYNLIRLVIFVNEKNLSSYLKIQYNLDYALKYCHKWKANYSKNAENWSNEMSLELKYSPEPDFFLGLFYFLKALDIKSKSKLVNESNLHFETVKKLFQDCYKYCENNNFRYYRKLGYLIQNGEGLNSLVGFREDIRKEDFRIFNGTLKSDKYAKNVYYAEIEETNFKLIAYNYKYSGIKITPVNIQNADRVNFNILIKRDKIYMRNVEIIRN